MRRPNQLAVGKICKHRHIFSYNRIGNRPVIIFAVFRFLFFVFILHLNVQCDMQKIANPRELLQLK